MLISEFARTAGMSVDTVRYYVRCGLITPELSGKGGSNPYQLFRAEHVEAARLVRVKEISALSTEYKKSSRSGRKAQQMLELQIAKLQEKSDQLIGALAYMKAKVAWIDNGEKGTEPRFGDYQDKTV